ncbi:MAG TPA: T9SS type A sorting domain-containing protein, partial [Flavobacteriales bacterium]|nr:T9SS type A sorting domain-containing protein [Flavobacteriales bacterium]
SYLAVGSANTGAPYLTQLAVTHFSAAGDSLWTRYYGDTLWDAAAGIAPHPYGYMALGTKNWFSDQLPPVYFIHPDSVGAPDVSTGVTRTNTTDAWHVYPNPTRDALNIVRSSALTDAVLTLTDATGREVLRKRFNGTTEVLDLVGLARGFYVLSVRSRESRHSERIVLE